MKYLGDIFEDQALTFAFNTHVSGTPTTLGGTPALSVYKGSSLVQTTIGPTLTVDFDGVTGLNHVSLVTTDAFYVASENYRVVITTGTVGGNSVAGVVVAEFSIENRNDKADVREVNGAAASVESGTQEVNVVSISGDANAADNLKAATRNIVTGTVTGAGSTATNIVLLTISPTPTAADQLKGRILIFDRATATAALRGQASDITGSSTTALTVTALSTAPAEDDSFTIQ